MDGYPVLEIVRCQFGAEAAAAAAAAFNVGGSSPGYPLVGLGPRSHSHSHWTHPLSHAHLTAYPCRSSRLYGGNDDEDESGCCKKYVVLCCLCGGLSAAVGSLFLAVHAVLSAHTASLALFETVPSYIPGTMLILMGIFTIFLARRKHRYGFLMKMCGSVGVVCALVCVLVTVTTTVVHMSRLQGLRECIYTKIARSCTCYGSTQGRMLSDPGVLFEETPHCEAVHGALYDCLRALFGVSVAGILACIFSCMLLYQLLSHEKKKMYWEQLQLRCRSLYGHGGSGAAGGASGGSCGCCNDCGGTSPWWARTPGNLYTPNPDSAPFGRRWRLPWSRSRGPAPTPDSNYGFHAQSRSAVVARSSGSSSAEPGDNTPGPYSVLTEESRIVGGPGGNVGGVVGLGDPYALVNSSGSMPYAARASSAASYSLLENGPVVPALWGPPPPYSDPNSPARRSRLTPAPPNPPSGTPIDLSTAGISGSCQEYGQQRVTNARPSDNYENTEELLSSGTEPEIEMAGLHHHQQQQQHSHSHVHSHRQPQRQPDEDGTKGGRTRRALKGVENGAFQQESGSNSLTKQLESELYFGDVSSCCGPESSIYDSALEKDNSLAEYPACNRSSKQRQSSSKRSRLPLPPPSGLGPETLAGTLTERYTALKNSSLPEDKGRGSSTRGPFLAPDAQYEVIAQQARYTYYGPRNSERVLDATLSSLGSTAHRNSSSSEQIDAATGLGPETPSLEHRENNEARASAPTEPSTSPASTISSSSSSSSSSSPAMPRVSDAGEHGGIDESSGNLRDSSWQNEHRVRAAEGVCPVNV